MGSRSGPLSWKGWGYFPGHQVGCLEVRAFTKCQHTEIGMTQATLWARAVSSRDWGQGLTGLWQLLPLVTTLMSLPKRLAWKQSQLGEM